MICREPSRTTFGRSNPLQRRLPLPHEAQIRTGKVPDIGNDIRYPGGRHTKPLGECRGILIDAGGRNPSSPRPGPGAAIGRPVERQGGEGPEKVPAHDAVAHHELMAAPSVVRTSAGPLPSVLDS